MRESWRSEWPFVATIGAMFAASAWAWSRVPERLPVHWNAAGEIDRWGGRGEALLTLPFAAVGLHLLLLLVRRIDPGAENYRSFADAFRKVRWALLLMLVAIHGMLIATAMGARIDVLTGVYVTAGLLHVALGGLMGKIRPNWFLGMRTPWSLSSKLSWVQTNRVGGFLFVAAGLVMIVVALAWPRAALATVFVAALAPNLFCLVYSWWVWRRDPDRLPPAMTRPADNGPASST